MKEPKFKKGEWCFCEFKLKQIKSTEDDKIRSVTDGYTEHSSTDFSDRCYPLNMKIKMISGEVKFWSNKFRALKNNSLNYPDINRELISRWVDMCDNCNDDKKIKELYKSLADFGNDLIRRVNDLTYEQVGGVKLFR